MPCQGSLYRVLISVAFPYGNRSCHNCHVGARGATGSEFRARAGALTLTYLSSGLERDTLRTVLAEATTGVDLIEPDDLTEADEATMIASVFSDRYLLEPVDPTDDPDDPETMMQPTPAGREVPFVGAALQGWLNRCPAGPIQLGQGSGQALWPLLSGWASTVVHAIAPGPRTFAEVCEAVAVLDEEAVDARIGLLEEAGLVRALPAEEDDGEPRFEATEWLRRGIAPLAAAARMELRHPREDTAPIAAADVGAALQLTLPLLRMKRGLSGSCSLEIALDEGIVGGPVGVTARIERGRVVACERGIDPEADAWVEGSTAAWLDAVIDADRGSVRSGGNRRLPRNLLGGLHKALFGRG
jgi:hypothetical protein